MKESARQVQGSPSKAVYVFSPKAFDDLYRKVVTEKVNASEILAEFEKNKIIEAFSTLDTFKN
jgi:hypothetical protein